MPLMDAYGIAAVLIAWAILATISVVYSGKHREARKEARREARRCCFLPEGSRERRKRRERISCGLGSTKALIPSPRTILSACQLIRISTAPLRCEVATALDALCRAHRAIGPRPPATEDSFLP